MGLGDVNAIEVFHRVIWQHGHLSVLVQQVTELRISFLKLAHNGKIVKHSKKEDELIIKSAVVKHGACIVFLNLIVIRTKLQ
jgi:hypothetical protein